jgi:hypothetical protein
MSEPWLPGRKDRLRMAAASFGLGLFFIPMDIYWGNGHGALALTLLLAGSACSQAFEYARYADLLRRPRLPDAYLVAGAGYRQREALARSAADRIALQSGAAGLLAGLTALAPQAAHPLIAASGLAGIALEAFLIWAMFRWAVSLGWFAPSRAAFHGRRDGGKPAGRKPGSKGASGSGTGSFWLPFSGTLARKAAARLPAPYGWLFARKTLHVLREDPVAPALLAALALGAAAAFRASGDLFLCGFFALAGSMASLCLARRLGSACDLFASDHGYLFPARGYRFRCDWALALLVAAPFPLYYAGCAVSLSGFGAALRAQSVWQMALSALAFACLIPIDGFARGRREGTQAMLAGAYLGIAGILFMFPVYGILLAGACAAGAAALCLRMAKV